MANDEQDDERQIRAMIGEWMAATKAGDAEKVLSLVAEDAVFLQPGHPPMRKPAFAAAQSAQAGMKIEGTADIQEVKVLGEWAFTWTKLSVSVVPPGGERMTRHGFTLTVLNKQAGKWVIARDANMLGPTGPKA